MALPRAWAGSVVPATTIPTLPAVAPLVGVAALVGHLFITAPLFSLIAGSTLRFADIPGRSIGAIRIQEDHTLVDVPQQFVGQVLDKAGSYRIRQQEVTLTRN